ncbi:hypothetical protein FHW79_000969 [Azospirillum sp. OGB3]|uniref:hypothetical protein n=1 Tax=Azospirillum sp. OGB3 TaxID=2587012 RepID=UPI001605A1B7|nr:hypothetical protein [Azospirillum sp. OGB3]MBB3263373.1 hypothetical protein [Azospirillum sp. OGB3]
MPVTTTPPADINAWAIGVVHTFQRRMVSLITADQQGRIWVRRLCHCGAQSGRNPEAGWNQALGHIFAALPQVGEKV